MVIEVTSSASAQTGSYCCYGISWKELRVYYLVWSLESSLNSLNCAQLHSIMSMYSHHSSHDLFDIIKNAKLNNDTAGGVLRWACR